MSADAWVVYDQFMLEKSNGVQDLDDDVFAVILLNSTYVPNTASDVSYAGINANELPTLNGYTAGGVNVTPSLTKTAGNIEFSTSNPTFAAAGGDLTFRTAVIRNVTTGGLVAYSVLDGTPADTIISNGNGLQVDISTNAVYDESRV